MSESLPDDRESLPPSHFAKQGQPCCSRWGKTELELIALAYVQALANDGDTWKKLTREQAYALLNDKQRRHYGYLLGAFYEPWFQRVSGLITNADGAFAVGGYWR